MNQRYDHSQAVRKRDGIACPYCGKELGSLRRIRDMIAYCKEFYGQCQCGRKYTLKLTLSKTAVLSFRGCHMKIAC